MAHLRQRSPGSWEITYRAAGKTRTLTHRGSHKDAKAKGRELEDLAEVGVVLSKDRVATFLEKKWLPGIRATVSPITWRNYETSTRLVFIPKFGNLKLPELDTATIRAAWADLFAEGLAPSTIKETHRRLTAALSFAVESKLIPANPCIGWRGRGMPKAENETDDVAEVIATLTRVQVAQVIDAARGTAIFAPTVLALGLGARRGEISALRWDRIADDGKVTIREAIRQLSVKDVRIGPPKNKKRRVVRLPTSYLTLIREWRRTQAEQLLALGHRVRPDDFVCTDAAGRQMLPGRITDQFDALARRLGIDLSFHGLRHTHASLLIDAGESIATVQKRLGHSRPSTTLDIYTHAIEGDDADEADRLDAMLSG